MTPAIAGIAIIAIVLSGTADTPTASSSVGARVEIESFTAPREVARCIAVNIHRKMPELRVRTVAGESPEEGGHIVVTAPEPSFATFGVIRIDPSEEGSRLTAWLPDRSLAAAAPEVLARRLVAGC